MLSKHYPITGTGNGIARSCIGNYDIATAAYSVVFGRF